MAEEGNRAAGGIVVGKAEIGDRTVAAQKAAVLGEHCWCHPGRNSKRNTLEEQQGLHEIRRNEKENKGNKKRKKMDDVQAGSFRS